MSSATEVLSDASSAWARSSLQVVDVLDADRDADHVVGDADLLAPLGGHRRVRHGRGMADQRFDAAEALGERHQPHAVQQRARASRATRARTRSAPPKPRICRFASSCCGCVGSPG